LSIEAANLQLERAATRMAVFVAVCAAALLMVGSWQLVQPPRLGPRWFVAVPFGLFVALGLGHGRALRRILRQRLTRDGIELANRPGEFVIRWSEVTNVEVSDSALVLTGPHNRKAVIDLAYVGESRSIRDCVLGYLPVESLRRSPA
jgi:hypothetical protein